MDTLDDFTQWLAKELDWKAKSISSRENLIYPHSEDSYGLKIKEHKKGFEIYGNLINGYVGAVADLDHPTTILPKVSRLLEKYNRLYDMQQSSLVATVAEAIEEEEVDCVHVENMEGNSVTKLLDDASMWIFKNKVKVEDILVRKNGNWKLKILYQR